MLRKLFSQRPKSRHNPVLSQPKAPDIPGLLPVKPVDQLLAPHRGHIVQIDELAGISKTHFDKFYAQAIVAFARFVQQLPASEVHHHAGPGGMLTHGLEVCVNALKLRRPYLLSQSGEAEEISAKQDVWTYAVFAGALGHDLAKVATDQRVTLYDARHNETLWAPWTQFIDEQGLWYTTEFVRHGQYRLHEKASPLLIHRIIPADGMKWLASDPYVFAQWLAAITGDNEQASTVRKIVSLADQQSVSANLGADNTRLQNVKSKPLHEKILTALRFLLNEGELPLNRNGAAGWVKDDHCWLVSKRCVDAIREQLTTEGHSGIPTKNGRMFDIMQEHGILLPCGDRAIWPATVQGEDFSHELTLIKIPVASIWTNASQRPEDFQGSILTEAPDGSSLDTPQDSKRQDAAVISTENTDSNTGPTLEPENDAPSTQSAVSPQELESPPVPPQETAEPATSQPVQDSTPTVDEADILQFLPSESAESNPSESVSGTEPETVTLPSSTAVTTKSEPVSATTAPSPKPQNGERHQTTGKTVQPDSGDPVSQFFDWLRQGVQSKKITVNKAKARVHVVEDGVIVVTPGIFQDFAKSDANTGQLTWNSIQQKVLKKNWHVRDAKGLNVIRYRVKGQNRQTVINAVLFEDKTRVFGGMTPPDANYHLQRE